MTFDATTNFDEVRFTRRRILAELAFSAWIFNLQASPDAALQPSRRTSTGTPPSTEFDWDAFVQAVAARATAIVAEPNPDERKYIEELQRLMTGLRNTPEVKTPRSGGASFAIDWPYQVFPLDIIVIQMEPGAVIPHHDHRDYNAALRVMSGDVQVSNFEVVDGAAATSAGSTFRIRKTRAQRLFRGQTSGLCRTSDNIHFIRAGRKGAKLIDCLTLFHVNARSLYLDVESDPSDSAVELEARWKL